MFPFTFAEIMQIRLPLIVLLEVFRGMFRHQNVTSVSPIHDSLCDVDAGARAVGLLVSIRDFSDRTTVDAPAAPPVGVVPQGLAKFSGARPASSRSAPHSSW